ncbi:MAG: cupin domain-containing protein [Paracoccaceae bacterium]
MRTRHEKNARERHIVAATPREFWTEERCFITELLNSPLNAQASLAIARVEPGVTTELHRLMGITECYILRKGTGVLEIDGVRHELKTGEAAVIPAGAAQSIRNTGAGDLEFLCLCTPRFVPQSYVSMENT